MIERILPEQVVAVEAFADPPGIALFDEEAALVASAVEGRRREFATGRACARAALLRLGCPPGPLLPGYRGAPRWPAGFTGSLTHCPGYRAAAVARCDRFTAIGIDAEPAAALPVGVFALVSRPSERALVGDPRIAAPADRLVFSAKEAVYKAWSTATGEWLDFHQVEITPGADPGTFLAHILRSPRSRPFPVRLPGRWRAANGYLLTAVAVPAGSAA